MQVAEQSSRTRNRSIAFRMLAIETGIVAIAAIALAVGMDDASARSAALGGLTFILPNALFANYAFRRSADESPAAALRWLYAGEVLKLFSTALLFAFSFLALGPLHAGVLFGTYGVLWLINVAGLAYLTR